MIFKKIVVNTYDSKGNMVTKLTLTTKKGIDAKDYKQAKKQVQNILSEVKWKIGAIYTVEWMRDYLFEGYRVPTR